MALYGVNSRRQVPAPRNGESRSLHRKIGQLMMRWIKGGGGEYKNWEERRSREPPEMISPTVSPAYQN